MTFDLNLSEDQRQIRDAASAMLESFFPLGRLRSHQPDSLAPLVEFGLFTLALPEEQGGSGLSAMEEALLHAMLGRHVVSTRALATAIATCLAAAEARTDLVARAQQGSLAASPALLSGSSVLLAEPSSDGLALVFADRNLRIVSLEDASIEPERGLGGSIPMGRTSMGRVATIAETSDANILAHADLLVSAQLLGIAEGARDLAVAYAKVRTQFGSPIGAFQAIRHHCATMAVETEMLSSLLDMAAVALADGHPDAPFHVAALRQLAPKIALASARTCIQIHGGIGFSEEAEAHHFLKQAHLLGRLVSKGSIMDHAAPLAPYRNREE